MTAVLVNCAYCGRSCDRRTGEVNRAIQRGQNLYCDRVCSGRGRRSLIVKTVEQQKAEKARYDAERRVKLAAEIKAKKAAYHKSTYDPAKAAEARKKRMPLHVEYCRRPEYRAYKRDYDRKYRAIKDYGEFAECALLVLDIREECLSRMTDYEIRIDKGTLNKSQKRRREYERTISSRPEEGPLGNLELSERGQNGGLASGLYRLSSQRNSAHDEHSVAGGSAGQETSSD